MITVPRKCRKSHFSFLPPEGGRQVAEPKKFKEYHCTFRDRLHEEGSKGDHWWSYGTTDAEAEVSLADLIDMYKRRGALFFARFEPFPEVFERMTPADIDKPDLSKVSALLNPPYAAMIIARVMKHLGHGEKCRQFAEAGLRHVGRATRLQWELEQLRDTC